MFAKNKRVINKKFLNLLKNQSCIICARWPSDPCHIKTVKTGGPDHPKNVIPLCRTHHTMQHAKGWIYMLASFPSLNVILRERGWDIIDVGYGKKLVNYELFDSGVTETEIELKFNAPN